MPGGIGGAGVGGSPQNGGNNTLIMVALVLIIVLGIALVIGSATGGV